MCDQVFEVYLAVPGLVPARNLAEKPGQGSGENWAPDETRRRIPGELKLSRQDSEETSGNGFEDGPPGEVGEGFQDEAADHVTFGLAFEDRLEDRTDLASEESFGGAGRFGRHRGHDSAEMEALQESYIYRYKYRYRHRRLNL